MIFTIGRAATILALCLSLGLHWVALQSVAWTTMLVENACHVPLSDAVAKTFDGNHPCDLCHMVATGQKSEKKSEMLPTVGKMDLICTTRTLSWLPPWVSYDYPRINSAIPERSQAPPVPPPRLLPG
ncbi:MAG TPA: hypothetical protein VNW28_07725 [Chthoniobacterales bacterium]|nr:hypothetical protein [Chthoniobacterales bacterium]